MVFSVTDILNIVYRKIYFDDEIGGNITIRGEIASFKTHGRHAYFSVKDSESVLKCVYFSYISSHGEEYPTGTLVDITGQLKIYNPRGDLQLYASRIEKISEKGILQIKYEKMKRKLLDEGIIPKPADEKHEIPFFPRKISVIASRTSAALQDIIKTLNLRNPLITINIHHSSVQGSLAHKELIKAIESAENGSSELIILARGGGSVEDLWAFNEEELIRKVRNCSKPIVVGIGHETDHCLSEYAADLIASTPTAAAMLASHKIDEIVENSRTKLMSISAKLAYRTDNNKNHIHMMKRHLIKVHPLELIKNKKTTLNHKMALGLRNINRIHSLKKKEMLKIRAMLRANSPNNNLETLKMEFDGKIKQLIQLNPLNTLLRGYSWVEKDNRIIESCKGIHKGDEIKIRMKDGIMSAEVKDLTEEKTSERVGFDEKEFKGRKYRRIDGKN